MRRLPVVFLVLVAAAVFAAGPPEVTTDEIVFGFGKGGPFPNEDQMPGWLDELDAVVGCKVVQRPFEIKGGSTETIRIALAGGETIHTFYGYGGRVPEFANPKYAVPIPLSHSEKAQYLDGMLEQFQIDGKQYALPAWGWMATMCANTDLIREAGAVLPADDDLQRGWSRDQFLDMCEKVKLLDKYGTYLFAGSISGEYYMWGHFGAAGVNLYDKKGRIAVNNKAGIDTLQFLVDIQDNGYCPMGVAGLSEKEGREGWMAGNIAARGGTEKYITIYPASGVENGLIDEEFHAVAMGFPTPNGDPSPMVPGIDGAMVFKGYDEATTAAAIRAIKFVTGFERQSFAVFQGKVTSLKGVEPNESFAWQCIQQMAIDHGVMNYGLTHPLHSKVGEVWIAKLQGAFTHEYTPAEALDEFEQEATRILAE